MRNMDSHNLKRGEVATLGSWSFAFGRVMGIFTWQKFFIQRFHDCVEDCMTDSWIPLVRMRVFISHSCQFLAKLLFL